MTWEKMKLAPKDDTEKILIFVKGGERFIVKYDAQKNAWVTVPGNYKKEPVRFARLPDAPEKFV